MKDLTWDEWLEMYPVPEVKEDPSDYAVYSSDNPVDSIKYADNEESDENCLRESKVVKFNERYYVV